jgi:Regulator of chromosome condensation (RCC1) repeat
VGDQRAQERRGQDSVRQDAHTPQVSAGWKHSGAVTTDGRLLMWGWGGSSGTPSAYEQQHSSGGQLGIGTDCDSWHPAHVRWLQVRGN